MGSRLVREGESELLKGDSEREKGKRLSGRRWGSFEWGRGRRGMKVSHNSIREGSAVVNVSQRMVLVSEAMRVGRGRYWLGRKPVLRR